VTGLSLVGEAGDGEWEREKPAGLCCDSEGRWCGRNDASCWLYNDPLGLAYLPLSLSLPLPAFLTFRSYFFFVFLLFYYSTSTLYASCDC
jgi:hypothetical protein